SAELFKTLANMDIEVQRFEASETSLNEIFIDIVGDSGNEKNR
ncbi:MAG: DUF4162 domain-containing protein, partial [Calditrichae bacterium]|nr:DUF4162 domain-containing protein [Calditrichia bacterium]